MSENSLELDPRLQQLNPLLNEIDGVYQNNCTQIRESQLSSYIQGAVHDSYNNVDDLSLFSVEIEDLLLTDELRHALSPAPYNFLLALELEGIGKTLDLSQDFGGVSHYLASRVEHVHSIKVDVGQARLSKQRCAEYQNINFISSDLSELKLSDKAYDLIVVSQLEELGLDKAAQAQLIKKLQLALTNTGKLLVNAVNQTRLNKWTSAGDQGIAYSHLYEQQSARYFSKDELYQALKTAGFLHWNAYASFSQNRAISNLLSEHYLNESPHSLNHFNRLGSIGHPEINEYLAIKNLHQEREELFSLASRFVMIASASAVRSEQLCDIDFAHFSGTGRKPQWRTTTLCKKDSNEVVKISLHPNFTTTDSQAKEASLSQSTEVQKFESGTLLLDQWLQALVSPNAATEFKELVSDYCKWLKGLEHGKEFGAGSYDILPFNIIVEDNDGDFKTIDPEWSVSDKFTPEFILFRALFWFAFENKALLKPLAKETGLSTIGLFVLHYIQCADENSTAKNMSDLNAYVELEESIQRQIGSSFRNKSIEYALLQTFDGEPLAERLQPACQISWSDSAGIVDEHNSVFISWQANEQERILTSESPSFEDGRNILRVDPIASMGLFKFSSISLKSQAGDIVWQLDSADEIAAQADCLNVSFSSDTQHFTALNDDPHFLFALNEVNALAEVQTIELSFAILHNQYYDASLATLSSALSEQNIALFRQIGSLETKQAEIEYLSAKLKNIDQHRQDLQRGQHEAQKAHEQHAHNLTVALETQTARVAELENNILIRYYFRGKRVAKRIIKKLIGRP